MPLKEKFLVTQSSPRTERRTIPRRASRGSTKQEAEAGARGEMGLSLYRASRGKQGRAGQVHSLALAT